MAVMAKKQTRRAISVNGRAYKAAQKEARRRGVTLAALVELGFAALGIEIEPHPQQTPKLATANAKRRRESMAAQQKPKATKAKAKRRPESIPTKLPSRERQLLGDAVADAHGFA